MCNIEKTMDDVLRGIAALQREDPKVYTGIGELEQLRIKPYAPPCSQQRIEDFEKKYKVELPKDYVRFVTTFNGISICDGAVKIDEFESVERCMYIYDTFEEDHLLCIGWSDNSGDAFYIDCSTPSGEVLYSPEGMGPYISLRMRFAYFLQNLLICNGISFWRLGDVDEKFQKQKKKKKKKQKEKAGGRP